MTSDADGMPEIVGNGVAGVVTSNVTGLGLAAEVVRLLGDTQKLIGMSQRGRERAVEKFSSARVAGIVADAIQKLPIRSAVDRQPQADIVPAFERAVVSAPDSSSLEPTPSQSRLLRRQVRVRAIPVAFKNRVAIGRCIVGKSGVGRAESATPPCSAPYFPETQRRAVSSTFSYGDFQEECGMRRVALVMLAVGVGCGLGFFAASKTLTVHGQAKPGQGFVAIPGQVGGQDIFGAYDVVKGWPKDISTLPGNEKWTWGAGQGIYAENPNRVFLLFRGELPNIKRPATQRCFLNSARAFRFRSAGCPGATPPLPPCPERAAPVRIPTMVRSSGAARRRPSAKSVSTPSGKTASPWSTPTATSSRPGPSGTRSSSGPTL